MGEVHELGAHENMTVRDALELSLRQVSKFQCVMVIGFDRDGDLMCRSSAMERAAANWLLDSAKQWALTGKTEIAIHPAEKAE